LLDQWALRFAKLQGECLGLLTARSPEVKLSEKEERKKGTTTQQNIPDQKIC
jgi:hypothetical protein